MTADIVTMPLSFSKLAERIRAAFTRTEHGKQEWIEGTLELAVALAEARERFPNDQQFSYWLVDNDLECIGHQHRAALINMASDLVTARIVLEETKRTSWRYIWEEEMKARFTYVGKPQQPTTENPNPAESAAEAAPSETANPEKQESARPERRKLPHRALRGRERSAEVIAVYRANKTRSELNCYLKGHKNVAPQIWSLILTALDAGFLTPTEIEFQALTMRILFPTGNQQYCGRFNLTKTNDRREVAERIMPAALAHRDEVIADPQRLESIVAEHYRQKDEAAQQAAQQKRMDKAMAAMEPGQQRVVMYGQLMWPRLDDRNGVYNYDQLRAAIWYAQDTLRWMETTSIAKGPKGHAILLRLSVKWFQQFADQVSPVTDTVYRRVFSLVHQIAGYLEQNPTGECIVPLSPKAGEKW